jgi:signal transduction histidine kinase
MCGLGTNWTAGMRRAERRRRKRETGACAERAERRTGGVEVARHVARATGVGEWEKQAAAGASPQTNIGGKRGYSFSNTPHSGLAAARRQVSLAVAVVTPPLRSALCLSVFRACRPPALRRVAAVCAALCACVAVDAADSLIRGLPFTRTYSLDDIGYVPRGSRLNFDSFGRIAVIHDGVYAVLNDTAWINVAHTDEASRTPMNDVVHAGYGRTYYGGRASWGLAEFGSDGKIHAKPLVPPNPPAWTRTTTFTEVIVTIDGVYFSSRNGVAFWDFAEKQSHLYELPRLSRVFAVGNRVFVSCFDRALCYIDVKARTVRAAPASLLDGQPVDRAAPLGDGRTLVALLDGRLFVFDGQKAEPWAGQRDGQLKDRIAAMRTLADGNIAIAISGKGLFILSPGGELVSALTTPQYHQVSSMASREAGVLWVLTEDSIEKVLYTGGLTSFGQRQGVTLLWPQVAKWQDRTFVASGRVLYEAVSPSPAATARFRRVEPQPPGGAVALTARGPHLLIGGPDAIYEMTSTGRLKAIAQFRGLGHLAMIDEKQCYAVGSSEIALFEWDGHGWIEPVPRIAGLAHPYSLLRTKRGVWVEMSGDGVARITRKGDKLDVMILRNETWTKALWVNLGVVGDTVVLSALREPRRFFDEATESWCELPELARMLDSSTRWLSRVWQDETGVLWAAHNEGLVRYTPRGEMYDVDDSSFDLINDRYPIVHVLPGNDIWVTASRSLHHVERESKPLTTADTQPVLVSLMDTRRNVELLARRLQHEPLRLSYSQNSLTFRFFSGSYEWRRAPVYEFRMNEGESWSRLETGSLLPFPSLRDGRYNLQVRIAEDRSTGGPPMAFAFEILPPWHRTWSAYGLYAAALLFGVFGVIRWSGNLARHRNRVLESLVHDRTRELESTMQKLQDETSVTATLAERDRLAGEIHDSVQQGLSGAILQLDSTLKQPSLAGDLRTRLDLVRNMVAYARQEVLHTVWDMDSPLLEGNDLGEALRKLTTFTISNTLVPSVTITGEPLPLPRRTTHHLLRIAQEATTNAVRHAQAKQIDIRLEYRADSVALTIIDDGIGFQLDDTLGTKGHFGLNGMRSRAKKLDGTLTFRSAPGAGTSIQIVIPMAPPI